MHPMIYRPRWLARYDLPRFIARTLQAIDPAAEYMPNWHIYLLAEYLEAARRKEIKRLLINMPPRALKSVCVSVAWPAWILGHEPSSRILAASYASSLSVKHSIDCRLVMQSPWYQELFPQTAMSREQNEKHKFMTSKRGFRLATSVGGGATGEGGNILIIDDPLNPLQARSRYWRNHVNEWFGHTFASRLDSKQDGVIVLVMQRLHQNDLSGHLLEQGGWEHICLPAVASQNHLYGFRNIQKEYRFGELLHPSREDMRIIERARIDLGSTVFAAQYQQRPVSEEGGMVRREWFGRYKHAPESADRFVQSWDTAIKSGGHHDASVCLTFAEFGGRSYLIDARVARYEYPELKRLFYAMAAQWKPQAILVEDRASGQQLLQDVKRETALPLVAVQPKNDKVTRFAAVSAMIEAGRVFLPENAPWLSDFEQEVYAFPGGENDDQVDALTQYLDWLRSSVWEGLRIRRI